MLKKAYLYKVLGIILSVSVIISMFAVLPSSVNATSAPSSFTVTSPGTSSQPGQKITDLTPYFQWQASSGADYYGLYISEYPYGSAHLVFDSEVDYGQISGTSFTLSSAKQLQPGKKYRWNMRAYNSAGYTGSANTLYFYYGESLPSVHDMAVTDVYTSPGSPNIGQSTTIYVTVKNEGNQQENSVPVKAYVDGSQVGSTQYVSLPADQSTTKSSTWTPSTEGTYPVKGEVSVVSGETETGDNSKTINVAVTTALVHDMAVTHVYTSLVSPNIGQSTTIYVTVRNEGNQQENSVPVKAYVDGSQVGSTQYVSLSADQSTTKPFTWTPSAEGTYPVKGEVGTVSGETDTGDNSKTINVAVIPPTPAEDVFWLAKIILSEASIGTQEERTAVGWTVLNRLNSGEYGENVEKVAKGEGKRDGGYSYNQGPESLPKEQEWLENQDSYTKNVWLTIYKPLAQELWKGRDNTYSDPTGGATYFFSPRGMPKRGEPTEGCDVGGGLHKVSGTSEEVYFPSWAKPKEGWTVTDFYQTVENLEWVCGLENVRNWYFMFYRPVSSRSVAKPTIVSSLKIAPQEDEYHVGDTLTAEFTIKNAGTAPITFDVLTVGGRDPEGDVADFEWETSITLSPNDAHIYTGSLTLHKIGEYNFFCAYYVENPTPEEKELLDENNWNTSIVLGQGLTDKDRAKTIVVDITKLREAINVRLRFQVTYPPYLLDPDSFTSAVSTVWLTFTDWVTQARLNEKYDELYQAGIEYDCLRFSALIKARNYLDRGDIATAQEYLQKSDTYAKLSANSFQAATDIYIGNLDAGEILAEGIRDGCEASVKFGLGVTNPTSAKIADYIYIGVDYAVDCAVLGEEPAAKNAIIKAAVTTLFSEVPFEELGGRTIADYTKNRVGKVTFPMLQEAFQSNEQLQFLLSKAIKEAGVASLEMAAEDVITQILNELEKGVNLERIEVKSPAELRVYASHGQATGLLNGEVIHEIPRSVYDKGKVTIFFPTDSYSYAVAGTEEGAYGLEITSVEEGETNTLTLTDVPTTPGEVHEYTVDWDALSQGEKGVTVQIDSDADGIPEQTTAIQPPVALFTCPLENLVAEQGITFDAARSYDADGEITFYEWEFGDGNTASGQVVTHTYSTAGNYTVTLTVIDDDGTLSTYSRSIQVGERQQGVSIWVWIAVGLVVALAMALWIWRERPRRRTPEPNVEARTGSSNK